MTAEAPAADAEAPVEERQPIWRQGLDRVKSGDLGSWPLVAGIVLIALFFYS